MRKPTTIDLFSGAGGITEGFKQAGYECVFANDINDHAMRTFRRNHGEVDAVCSAIEDLDARQIRTGLGMAPGELDCLAGGPPCQGFSINAPSRFLEDPRNSLFRDYIRFLNEFKPRTFLFENVPGMLSLAGGLVVQQILREFMAAGYDVREHVLFAAHYGVPQERWRLIILGSRVGTAPCHPRPRHLAKGRANFTGGKSLTLHVDELHAHHLNPHVTVSDAIGDLPRLEPGEGYEEMAYDQPAHSRYAEVMRTGSLHVANHVAPRISAVNLERLRHIQPGGSWRDIPFELLPAGMKKARKSDHTRRYGRLRADGLSGTVMTKMDPHWGPAFHYEQARTLTVREAARLQSFPDAFIFTGPKVAQYEQVGNAVPVLMARAIAESLYLSIAEAEASLIRILA